MINRIRRILDACCPVIEVKPSAVASSIRSTLRRIEEYEEQIEVAERRLAWLNDRLCDEIERENYDEQD